MPFLHLLSNWLLDQPRRIQRSPASSFCPELFGALGHLSGELHSVGSDSLYRPAFLVSWTLVVVKVVLDIGFFLGKIWNGKFAYSKSEVLGTTTRSTTEERLLTFNDTERRKPWAQSTNCWQTLCGSVRLSLPARHSQQRQHRSSSFGSMNFLLIHGPSSGAPVAQWEHLEPEV